MVVEELVGRLVFQAKGVDQAREAAKAIGNLRKALNGLAGTARVRLDGPAQIARSFKQIADAARKAQAAQRSLGTASFGQADAAVNRHTAAVTRLGAAYRHAAGQARALAVAGQGPSWALREIAHLRDYAALQRQIASQQRALGPRQGAGRVALGRGGLPPLTRYGGGAGTYGPYGSGQSVENRATRAASDAVLDTGQERSRQTLSGLTDDEKKAIRKRALELSSQYPSIGSTEVETLGRSARNAVPGFDKAIEFMGDLVRMQVALQSSRGIKESADQMTRFTKALDNMARLENLDEARTLMNAVLRATNVEGKELAPRDYQQIAKKAKTAGATLSAEFLGTDAATLAQDMGAPELGTALGTMVSQIISGRATKQSKRMQEQLGVADWGLTGFTAEQIRDREAQGIKQGAGVVDPDMLAKHPSKWASTYLMPGIQKSLGFDPNDNKNDTKTSKAVSDAFSAQTVSNLMTKIVTQMPQLLRNREMYGKAQDGEEAAQTALREDPRVMIESGIQGPLNAIRQFTDAITTATSAVAGFTSSTGNAIARWLANDPATAVPVVGTGLAAGAYATAKVTGAAIGKTAEIAGKGWQTGVNEANGAPKAPGLGAKVAGVFRRILPPAAAVAEIARVSQASSWREAVGIPEPPTNKGAAPAATPAAGPVPAKVVSPLVSGSLERNRRSPADRAFHEARVRKATSAVAPYPDRESAVGPERMRMKFDGSAVEAAMATINRGAEAATQSLNSLGATNVRPNVDTSGIEAAQAKADRLKATLDGIGSAAGRASADIASGASITKGSNTFTGPTATAP